MASKPISENYKGCTIEAHNHGYTISGAFANVVNNQHRVATSVLTGEKILLPGPASDSLTWMQAAKQWIDMREATRG